MLELIIRRLFEGSATIIKVHTMTADTPVIPYRRLLAGFTGKLSAIKVRLSRNNARTGSPSTEFS